MPTPRSRPASVTLRDLADDLAYFVKVLEATRNEQPDREVMSTAIQGLRSLHEVIEGYAGAGFRIEPGEPHA